MTSGCSRIVVTSAVTVSALLLGTGPIWAGAPVPAPLVGVTGPYGIAAAGVIYGGYLLVRRFRKG